MRSSRGNLGPSRVLNRANRVRTGWAGRVDLFRLVPATTSINVYSPILTQRWPSRRAESEHYRDRRWSSRGRRTSRNRWEIVSRNSADAARPGWTAGAGRRIAAAPQRFRWALAVAPSVFDGKPAHMAEPEAHRDTRDVLFRLGRAQRFARPGKSRVTQVTHRRGALVAPEMLEQGSPRDSSGCRDIGKADR